MGFTIFSLLPAFAGTCFAGTSIDDWCGILSDEVECKERRMKKKTKCPVLVRCPVLIKLDNSHYIAIDSGSWEGEDCQIREFSLCHKDDLQDIEDGQVIGLEKMRELFAEPYPLEERRYLVSYRDDCYLFVPLKLRSRAGLEICGIAPYVGEAEEKEGKT